MNLVRECMEEVRIERIMKLAIITFKQFWLHQATLSYTGLTGWFKSIGTNQTELCAGFQIFKNFFWKVLHYFQ